MAKYTHEDVMALLKSVPGVTEHLEKKRLTFDEYLKRKDTTAEEFHKKDGCPHKDVETWFDEESGDNTIICNDCRAVFFNEDYLQRMIKEGK